MTEVNRAFLTDLLSRWRHGTDSAEDVVATDVLLMLATARSGLLAADISALLEFLATPEDHEADGRERFYSYIESVDSTSARRAIRVGTTARPLASMRKIPRSSFPDSNRGGCAEQFG